MKLVMAVVQDSDAGKLIEKLNKKRFGITKLASTGDFKSGNTTLMIGVEENRLEELLEIIKEMCRPRKRQLYPFLPVQQMLMFHILLKYQLEVLRFL